MTIGPAHNNEYEGPPSAPNCLWSQAPAGNFAYSWNVIGNALQIAIKPSPSMARKKILLKVDKTTTMYLHYKYETYPI
jgi:hypothetical protein